jgi:hypothetical protein
MLWPVACGDVRRKISGRTRSATRNLAAMPDRAAAAVGALLLDRRVAERRRSDKRALERD